MPEVMSYVVMSMKIVPNMEKAVHFAAENSNRPLARDLRKMLWNLHYEYMPEWTMPLSSFRRCGVRTANISNGIASDQRLYERNDLLNVL
jgi:hypothetical protein